jgi:hypothetical protein
MNSDEDTPDQVQGGLPHSETPGSPIARISPGLFAACHVLPRLSVPRHPPDALLLRLIAFHAARAQGQNPVPASAGTEPRRRPGPITTQAASHEDTSSDRLTAGAGCCHSDTRCAGPVRLGHMTTPSLPFNQHNAAADPQRDPLSSPNAGPFGVARAMPVAWPQLCCDRGGGERIRTDDLLLAKQALSQLSYTPGPEIRDQKTEIRNLIADLWLAISGTGGPGRI